MVVALDRVSEAAIAQVWAAGIPDLDLEATRGQAWAAAIGLVAVTVRVWVEAAIGRPLDRPRAPRRDQASPTSAVAQEVVPALEIVPAAATGQGRATFRDLVIDPAAVTDLAPDRAAGTYRG